VFRQGERGNTFREKRRQSVFAQQAKPDVDGTGRKKSSRHVLALCKQL
jgi:hypothetical protein